MFHFSLFLCNYAGWINIVCVEWQLSVRNCFIRGSVVRYVQLPPEGVDIELLHDATRREARGGWIMICLYPMNTWSKVLMVETICWSKLCIVCDLYLSKFSAFCLLKRVATRTCTWLEILIRYDFKISKSRKDLYLNSNLRL